MGFDLCTPEGVINRGDVPVEFGIRLGHQIASIDVAKADCTNTDDRRMIESAIETRLGGYGTMNKRIRDLVAAGLKILEQNQQEQFVQVHLELKRGSSDEATPSTVAMLENRLAEAENARLRAEAENVRLQLEVQRLLNENEALIARFHGRGRVAERLAASAAARRRAVASPPAGPSEPVSPILQSTVPVLPRMPGAANSTAQNR